MRALLLAAAVALGWSAPEAQARDECQACAGYQTRAPDTDEGTTRSTQEAAYFACKVMTSISCRGAGGTHTADSCWVAVLRDTVRAGAAAAANHMTRVLSDAVILTMLAVLAALTLVVDAGKMAASPKASLGESPIVGRLVRIALAVAVMVVCAEGYDKTLFRKAGEAATAGALMGRAAGVQLHGLYTGEPSSATCVKMADGGVDAWQLIGWTGLNRAVTVLLSHAIDLAAVMTGLAWTFLPNFGDMVEAHAAVWAEGNFRAIFEVMKIIFAITLVGTGLTLALTITFQALEAIMVLGIAVGITPVLGWAAVWQGTRKVPVQILSAVLYACLSLGFLSVTLEASYRTMEMAMSLFAGGVANEDYADRPAIYGCGFIYREGMGGSKRFEPTRADMMGIFDSYMCLMELPDLEIVVDGTPERSKASHSAGSVADWITPMLILIGAGIIVTALMRYANAAASELTGFRASQNQVAQQAIGAAKGLLGGASKRLGAK